MNEAALRQSYEELAPALDAWGKFVTCQIRDGISAKLSPGVDVEAFLRIPPKHRVKSASSFLEKAIRNGKSYREPIREITDLVGTRFVVLLTRDIETIKQVIESCPCWRFESCRDYEEERRARPQHFDYQSVHYLVRSPLPVILNGIAVPIDLPCEVQVRTLLQHAYAELAHDTVYKPPVQIGPDVNRKVAKSAALVEATDDVFLSVAEEIGRATSRLSELHAIALNVYAKAIGPPTAMDVRLTYRLLDPYREQLEAVTSADLEAFLRETEVVDAIKQHAPLSVLFSHPVAIWLYWLASNWRLLVPTRWPINPEYLETIYADLSISLESQ